MSSLRAFRVVFVAGLAFLLAGFAAAAAAASPRPEQISVAGPGGVLVGDPQLAVDGHGDLTAVWQQTSGRTSDYVVMVADRRPGQAWSRAVQLSVPESLPAGLTSDDLFPSVSVAADGAAVVAWQDQTQIEAVQRTSAGGAWSAPAVLAAPGVIPEPPVTGIARDGQATVLWTGQTGRNESFVEAVSGRVGGGWSRPVMLARSARLLDAAQLAMSPAGATAAVWDQVRPGAIVGSPATSSRVYAATEPRPGSRWGAAVDLGSEIQPAGQTDASNEAGGPQVAVGADGDAIAVWQSGSAAHEYVATATHAGSGGRWARRRSPSTAAGIDPRVSVDARGIATVLWQDARDRFSIATGLLPDLSWSSATGIATGSAGAEDPVISAGFARESAVAWSVGNGPVELVGRAGRAGRWRVIARVGSDTVTPAVVPLSSRSTAACWVQGGGVTAGGDAVSTIQCVTVSD